MCLEEPPQSAHKAPEVVVSLVQLFQAGTQAFQLALGVAWVKMCKHQQQLLLLLCTPAYVSQVMHIPQDIDFISQKKEQSRNNERAFTAEGTFSEFQAQPTSVQVHCAPHRPQLGLLNGLLICQSCTSHSLLSARHVQLGAALQGLLANEA